LHYNSLLRRYFWSGVLDADGSYKNEISLCSKSKFFVQSFGTFLADHNIPFKIRKLKNSLEDGYTLKTSVQFKKETGDLLLPRHVKKIQDYQDYINSKTYRPRKIQTDEISHLIKTNQNLRFKSFNKDHIIVNNSQKYFNFTHIANLGILHCQEFLKRLRKHLVWTQKQLADYLRISEKVLTSYENSSDITIRLLEKLLPLFPKDYPKSLMLFLKQNNLTTFRSRKTIAKLPFQPSEELLELIQQLKLRRGYLLIHPVNDHKEKVLIALGNFFTISKPTGYKLSNSVIFYFVKTFCKI